MVNDRWVIRWREYISNSYSYGSKIVFNDDNTVSYKNELMPPGTVIHEWKSKTNFQTHRLEPSLPLIDGESAYAINLNIIYNDNTKAEVMLRIVFYDRYDEIVDSTVMRDRMTILKPPIQTYSYSIELVNGGFADFVFDSLIIREVSGEEFDEYQQRIEKNKKYIKKGKGKIKRNRKVK